MNILVTGATGVIGRRLVPLLTRAGHDVTAVVRSPARRAALEREGAHCIELDLFDRFSASRAVEDRDAVINLATHMPRSSLQMALPWTWRDNDHLRREASRTLVDACLDSGVTRYVQESFAPVYEDNGDRWIDESWPIKPVRYNQTIADAEAAAERFTAGGGAGIVLRFGAFYGSDAVQTRDFIALVRKGWAPLPGAADAYISSVAHHDAATATAASLQLPAGTYNVVDDEPLTHRRFADSLAEALRVPHPRLPPRWFRLLLGSLGELMSRSLRISNRKLRSHSDWTPRFTSVADGWSSVEA